ALMLLQDARREARRGDELVLLEDQDRSLWDAGRIEEGRRVLRRIRIAGPYALQAAIAAEHLRPVTDWVAIAELYAHLAALTGSPVVELNRAVAVAMAAGPGGGLELMDAIDLPGYHLLHSARADLLRRLGRSDEARQAYEAALALAPSEPERRFLEGRLVDCSR